jgi:hypothetical protein
MFGTALGLHVGADFPGVIERWHETIATSGVTRSDDLAQLRAGANARGLCTLKDGRTIEYRQSVVKGGGFVRTYTDVTAEKALQDELQTAKERAEQAATAKSQFLAAMSHEIRTPMNGVIGIVELLRATPLNGEQKQMVEIIRQSGISLLALIEDILDFSKIESGALTLERGDVALAPLIEGVAELLATRAHAKDIEIATVIAPELPALISGDGIRLRQVLTNLIGNAVKFTEEGGVLVSAGIERRGDWMPRRVVADLAPVHDDVVWRGQAAAARDDDAVGRARDRDLLGADLGPPDEDPEAGNTGGWRNRLSGGDRRAAGVGQQQNATIEQAHRREDTTR